MFRLRHKPAIISEIETDMMDPVQLLDIAESLAHLGYVPVENTDYIELTQIQDWTLRYWLRQPRYELMGLCLGEKEIKKLSRILEFLPIEIVIEQFMEKNKMKFNIACLRTQIVKDPDTDDDTLLVEVFVKESDFEKILDLWKEISTEIRNEIDRKFKEKSMNYQRKLLIRVQPAR